MTTKGPNGAALVPCRCYAFIAFCVVAGVAGTVKTSTARQGHPDWYNSPDKEGHLNPIRADVVCELEEEYGLKRNKEGEKLQRLARSSITLSLVQEIYARPTTGEVYRHT